VIIIQAGRLKQHSRQCQNRQEKPYERRRFTWYITIYEKKKLEISVIKNALQYEYSLALKYPCERGTT